MKVSLAGKQTSTSIMKVFLIGVSGSFSLFISIGLGRFGYPPLISSLVAMKWVSTIQADYLGATNLSGYIIGAFATSGLHKLKICPYRIIMVSLAITILSFLFCALHPDYIGFVFWRFLSGMMGGIIMITAAPTIISLMSSKHKGFISGVIFSGVGLGIAFSGAIIPLLVTRSLAITWLSYFIISAVLFVFVGVYFPKSPLPKNNRVNPDKGIARINKELIILLIAYACNAIAFIPHTLFWVDFIDRGLHMGLTRGNHYWILFGVSAMAGPVLIGFSVDKTGFANTVIVSAVIRCAGLTLPVFYSSPVALVISSIFLGSLAIGYTSLIATRVQVLYGNINSIWASMTIAYALSHALAAYFFSYLFSRTNSFKIMFLTGAIVMGIGCLLDYWGAVYSIIGQHRRRQSDDE